MKLSLQENWNRLDLTVQNQVCQQVSYGIQALFGPSDLILGSHVQSLCDALVISLPSKVPKACFLLWTADVNNDTSYEWHFPGHPPPWGEGGHWQQLQGVKFEPSSQSRSDEPGLQGIEKRIGRDRVKLGWKANPSMFRNFVKYAQTLSTTLIFILNSVWKRDPPKTTTNIRHDFKSCTFST